jgi:hypothetical protein
VQLAPVQWHELQAPSAAWSSLSISLEAVALRAPTCAGAANVVPE